MKKNQIDTEFFCEHFLENVHMEAGEGDEGQQ
jgi:hypothetical protein